MTRSSALFVTTVPITLERFLAPFACEFRARGWRVDALASSAVSYPAIEADFDAIHDIGWTRSPRSLTRLRSLARRVREVVDSGGYDIVHVHTPIAAFATRFALRRRTLSRPVVIYTAHGFHFYRGGRPLPNLVYRTMERMAARWTDYLVTINAEDYEAARMFGTIPPERVRLIPGIGVDQGAFSRDGSTPDEALELRRQLRVSDDACLVLMIAEFGAVKRHAHVLRSLALVRDPRVVIVFVGEGPLEPDVRAQASALGLDERVRFAGYRRDIPRLLSAADALVLASEREGLPRSVLEAMSAAVPVVGTDTRGIADLVSSGAGWLARKHDPASLAHALEAAASDSAEASRRGQAGQALVTELYAFPRIFDTYEELYREALASRV